MPTIVIDGIQCGISKILDNGPDDEKFNVVLLSEGFTEPELRNFEKHCQDFKDYITQMNWFRTLSRAMNMHVLSIPAPESGVSDAKAEIKRNTLFNATYSGEGTGIERLIIINDEKAKEVLDRVLPDWHTALMLVNGLAFGGSGGRPFPGKPQDKKVAAAATFEDWIRVAMHEMGHAAFYLADEYEMDNPPNHIDYTVEPPFPNVTLCSTYETIKWRRFIEPGAEKPITVEDLKNGSIPNPDIIGLFEGAYYRHKGFYRPTRKCAMRDLSKANPFCRVCMEAIINRLRPFMGDTPALASNINFLETTKTEAAIELCNVGKVDITGISVQAVDAAKKESTGKYIKSNKPASKIFKAALKSGAGALAPGERTFVNITANTNNPKKSQYYGCLTILSNSEPLDIYIDAYI